MGREFDFDDWKPKHGHLQPSFLPPVHFSEVALLFSPERKIKYFLEEYL